MLGEALKIMARFAEKKRRLDGIHPTILKKRASYAQASKLCDALREAEYLLMQIVSDHPSMLVAAAGELVDQAALLRAFRYQVDRERGWLVDKVHLTSPLQPSSSDEYPSPRGWSGTLAGAKGPAGGGSLYSRGK